MVRIKKTKNKNSILNHPLCLRLIQVSSLCFFIIIVSKTYLFLDTAGHEKWAKEWDTTATTIQGQQRPQQSSRQQRKQSSGGNNIRHDNDDNKILSSTSSSSSSHPIRIITRSKDVKISTDVRGNLGPPSVMIQSTPGTNWLKDRWQAASDMHGTAIPGVHWVILEFPNNIALSSLNKIVIDWEAAYSNDYRIETKPSSSAVKDDNEWNVIFDSKNKDMVQRYRTVTESGQSPGVKTKTPLHIIHAITIPTTEEAFDDDENFVFLRLYIRKSAMGWGVSIWQLDVYGKIKLY